MHVNGFAKTMKLTSAKAKASEMRRAAQILLDRAAELDAVASKSGTDSGRNGVRLDPAVAAPRRGRGELAQIDARRLAAPLSNNGRQRRIKQPLYR